ncbi:MAG: MarR family transcriptional regulator [Gemmatimonadales bacterium]
MSLRDEIKQNKPFASLREEAVLNIMRTASLIAWEAGEAFRPFGLTTTQYNVLRILRGAGADGLPCGAIAERMVTRDSDITRLLDRLTGMHLVERGRAPADRRVVTVRITGAGLDLLAKLEPVIHELQLRQLGHLDSTTLAGLISALESARERPAVSLSTTDTTITS